MNNLMSGMYGGQPLPEHRLQQNKANTQTVNEKKDNGRSPHQSMADMMHIVEDMYNGGSEQTQLMQTNTSNAAPTETSQRRTRSGSDNQTSSGDGDQTKQAFKQWLQAFDQAVQALDASDKAKGDAMWKDIVACVDECWKNYTEQGQLPQ